MPSFTLKLLLSLTLIACVAGGAPARAQSVAPADAPLNLPRATRMTEDLDGIIKKRRVRILVAYSKTQFFPDKKHIYGTAAELGRRLETSLNKAYGGRIFKIGVMFVPTPRARLLDALVAGRGDIVAASLTDTPEREKQAAFVRPWLTDVKEVLVTGPAASTLKSLDDLAGQEIYVRKSSSYYPHVVALSDALAARKLAPIAIKPADEDLEDEDLMEMANAGLLPYVVVDDFKAQAWAKIFDKLTVREDLVIGSGNSIGWAVRKDNPKLRAALDTFVAENGLGTMFGNSLQKRYFTEGKILRNAYAPDDAARFQALVAIFKQYGEQYGFDHLMIGAQGYQESQLDQARRSPRGAVGVMQLLPRVAAGKEVGIRGIDKDAKANIHAGMRYMRYLADKYVNDPALDRKNRVLMTFAAYNAGPGNLRKFRRLAAREGFDPNVWFGNVENAAAKVVGQETVQYVSNIYKYYVGYSLLVERAQAAAAARQKAQEKLGDSSSAKP